MGSDLLLVVVVVTALAFDFTNGFHDTANAMATSIATKALKPKVAVGLAAVLNLAGAFVSIKVATTIAEGIVETDVLSLEVVFAGLLGAITWNLITWYLGLPSSSSHALIGGIVGATFAANGADAVQGSGIAEKVLIPALIAPVLAAGVAVVGTVLAYRLADRIGPEAKRGYRIGQVGSASLVALAHGTNDAQKTMGVITLALVAHGTLDPDNLAIPFWVKASAAVAIASGTYLGGWRIIRTLGSKVTDIEAPQGFAAESSGTAVILASSYYGYPLSTTHVVSGGVLGAGLGKRLAQVHWGVAGRIVLAWLITLPAAAGVAALAFEASDLFGSQAAGTTVVGCVAAAGAAYVAVLAHRDRVTAADV